MGARGPKPGFKHAQRQLLVSPAAVSMAAATPAPQAQPVVTAPAAPVAPQAVHKDPLQRAREIRTMEHPELRLYAKQIGIRQRDIDDLTLDRLRQNCALTVASLVEAYTE